MDRRWLVVVGAAACTPVEYDAAYVLLDAEAHDAGVEVRIGGEPVEGLLPEMLDPAAEVTVLADGAPQNVWVEPGVLHHVQGAHGRVEPWFLGADVGAERALLDATEDAAWALAEAADADLEAIDEGWLLDAPGLWSSLATTEGPDGLFETVPLSDLALPGVAQLDDALDDRSQGRFEGRALDRLRGAVDPAERARAEAAEARREAATWDLGQPSALVAPTGARRAMVGLVGRYCHDAQTWTLDAIGTARLDGRVVGTWTVDERGRVWAGGARLLPIDGGLVDAHGVLHVDGTKGGCDDDTP